MGIFVYGHNGEGNLGDDAMLRPLLEELPGGERVIVALGPKPRHVEDLLAARPRWEVVPRGYGGILRGLRRAELVVCAGGTHVHAASRQARYLKDCFRMLGLALLARLLGRPYVNRAIGLGPFRSRAAAWLGRGYLSLSSHSGLRDSASLRWAAANGARAGARREVDLAARVGWARLSPTVAVPGRVGLNALPFGTSYGGRRDNEQLVDNLVTLVRDRLRARPEGSVRLFQFSATDDRDDDRHILEAVERRVEDPRCRFVPYTGDLAASFQAMAQCEEFLSFRYHALLLSTLFCERVACVNYHGKCAQFLADYFGPEARSLDPEALAEARFDSAWADLPWLETAAPRQRLKAETVAHPATMAIFDGPATSSFESRIKAIGRESRTRS